MTRRLPIIFVLLGSMYTSVWANSDTKAGVLDLEVVKGSAVEQDLARTLTRTLRSLIRGERSWREVGKLSATLSDANLAFGCEVSNTNCMKGLARTLGVNVLLWGTVEREYSNVVLKIWGVSTQGATKLLQREFNRKALSKGLGELKKNRDLSFRKTLRKIAQPLVNALLKTPKQMVQFTARTEPVSALVFINGREMGRSPITVSLREGTYALRLKADGFEVHEETIHLAYGDEAQQPWLLQQKANASVTDAQPTSVRQIVRWTSLGIATTSLAASALFFNEANKILGPTQDTLCMQKPSECGAPNGTMATGTLPRSEFLNRESDYSAYSGAYYTSLALTTVALSTFASTFFFDWE